MSIAIVSDPPRSGGPTSRPVTFEGTVPGTGSADSSGLAVEQALARRAAAVAPRIHTRCLRVLRRRPDARRSRFGVGWDERRAVGRATRNLASWNTVEPPRRTPVAWT